MKLLLIGDDRKNRRMFAWGFNQGAYDVKMANSREAVTKLLDAGSFEAVCADLKMQEDDAMAILDDLHRQAPQLPIIALVGERPRKPDNFLREVGVRAQVVTPFTIATLHAALRSHALPSLPSESSLPRPDSAAGAKPPRETPSPAPSAPAPTANSNGAGNGHGGASGAPRLSTFDEFSRRSLELALRAANTSAAILILGETGTGKSLLAQTIHQNSPIRSKPFITVNCPCLNHELLESDLFGHVRGAFTGAVQDTWGKVAAAEGGTLFLDEIGDLPMAIQPKLLRLLQEKQYERVGEATSRSANVRIVAATNRDLKREVAAGRFREDLYYRINVIAVDTPPLRGRRAQIMGAADAFLEIICRQLGRESPGFTGETQQILENYAWPGNLRELRNLVERAAILSNGAPLAIDDFPALIAQTPASRFQVGSAISLQALETAHIQMVIANSATLEEAAHILGIDKSTLYRKRKQMEPTLAAKFAARGFEAVAS